MERFVSCYLLISDRIFPSLDIFSASLFRMSELAAATADEAEPSAAPMAEEAPADNDDDDEVVDDSDDDTSDLSLSERFARAAKHKEQGNARFKSGDPAAAAAEYRSGLGLVDELAKQEADRKASLTPGEAAERDELALSLQVRARREESARIRARTWRSLSLSLRARNGPSPTERARARAPRAAPQLNLAMVLIKTREWAPAAKAATAALGVRGADKNVKALYRRGLARARLSLLDGAKADLALALQLDPTNRDAKVRARERARSRLPLRERSLSDTATRSASSRA